MNIKILIANICILLMMTGCTESETLTRELPGNTGAINKGATNNGATNNDAVEASEGAAEILLKAKLVYLKAKEKQHAWSITTRMMEAAEKALASGDEKAAVNAATRALFTAEASLAQAESQAIAWQARVPQ